MLTTALVHRHQTAPNNMALQHDEWTYFLQELSADSSFLLITQEHIPPDNK